MPRDGAIVRAIDTNVLARFLFDDDPIQSPIAAAMIADGVHIPLTVLVETGWLLASRYHQARGATAAILHAVLDLPDAHVVQPAGVRWAIDRYAAGADLADMMHVVAASSSDGFATFDRGLAKAAGSDAPVPIETL